MNQSPKNLHELALYIEENFQFNAQKYKNYPDSEPGAQLFALRHMKDHMCKSVGAMSALFEAADHTGDFTTGNIEEMKILTTKMLINTLKMAELLDLSPDELLEEVPKIVK